MNVGILGCGAIANIITNFAVEGKLGVDLKFFYDRDMERAENLASQVDGTVVLNIDNMLGQSRSCYRGCFTPSSFRNCTSSIRKWCRYYYNEYWSFDGS